MAGKVRWSEQITSVSELTFKPSGRILAMVSAVICVYGLVSDIQAGSSGQPYTTFKYLPDIMYVYVSYFAAKFLHFKQGMQNVPRSKWRCDPFCSLSGRG